MGYQIHGCIVVKRHERSRDMQTESHVRAINVHRRKSIFRHVFGMQIIKLPLVLLNTPGLRG
jgi:hypothetical protein